MLLKCLSVDEKVVIVTKKIQGIKLLRNEY